MNLLPEHDSPKCDTAYLLCHRLMRLSPGRQGSLAAGSLEKANTFYARGSWDSAAHYYENLTKAGGADAAVYYNLGNAHYKLGHTGAAILAYHRALLRNPRYKVASENLRLVESRIPGRLQPPEDVFFVRWWQSLTASHYSRHLGNCCIVSFAVAILLLTES